MELFRALATLAEPPAPGSQRIADALELGEVPEETEHTDLFLFQLYPYASVYLGGEGMMGGEARDRIAGFWRVLEGTPPTEPDHLAVMLALQARLAELEAREDGGPGSDAWRRVRRAFLWEHLLSWLPAYLTKLREIAGPFYVRWSTLLEAALREEAAAVGVQRRLPLHLREAPGPAGPEEGRDGLLGWLLSPVRSGVILVRSDLRRAGRELGLGLRVAERRYALQAFLAQDGRATLGWLGREAARWIEHHRANADLSGPAAAHWTQRAETAHRILSSEGILEEEKET